uniref:Uncharacterized protein n=1 Tax=Tetradesmus obliquus TaxID=3088 RepID=A0A383WK48_TETOB|eukprot:jgi/Sobl393_1/10875/SZX77549.1
MPKWGLLQRLSGRYALTNGSSPSHVLQGSCKHTNGVANDAKTGLVDVAEETVGTLQEVVEVDLPRLCLSLGATAAMLALVVGL